MRILITGGLGHIGSALIRQPSQHEIVVLDNLRSQRYCSLFDTPSLKFICGDIGESLSDLGPFDVVVHLAGIINAAEIERDPDEAYFINAAKTAKLARDCKDWGARMILASTTSVYHGGDGWLTEKSPLEPPTHYAKSKVMAEVGVLHILQNKYTILRFGTIFGWSPGVRFDTAVQNFCWRAFLGVPIEIWKSSQHKLRPYLGINDCVQAINLAIDVDLVGTYNVVTDHFTPQNVVDLIDVPKQVEYIDDPVISQESYRVSNDKIKEYGFEPQDVLLSEIDLLLKKLGAKC